MWSGSVMTAQTTSSGAATRISRSMRSGTMLCPPYVQRLVALPYLATRN
jgi:hypothetical protein